jgi:chromosome segregation protein
VQRTMQSCDVLYGVTMQEPGISRIVSVKVNESAQRRSGVPGEDRDRAHVQVA